MKQKQEQGQNVDAEQKQKDIYTKDMGLLAGLINSLDDPRFISQTGKTISPKNPLSSTTKIPISGKTINETRKELSKDAKKVVKQIEDAYKTEINKLDNEVKAASTSPPKIQFMSKK